MNKNKFIESLVNLKEAFNFDLINKPNTHTQDRADITEGYIKKWIEDLISDNYDDYYLIQAGSQEPLDFILINKNSIDNWSEEWKNKFNLKYSVDQKVNRLIRSNYDDLNQFEKESILKMEVKAGKGNYYCNDTFPDPINPTVFFIFDWKNNELLVSTSVEMAKQQGREKQEYILKKYLEDKKQVSEWRTSKKEQWKELGVGSTPRMTYTINSTYAHTKQNDETYEQIFEIFNKVLKAGKNE